MNPTSLDDCRALDAKDPLHELSHQFQLPPGVIYLDGNSLGALPRTSAARVAEVVTQEWGQGLIRSWNSAGWFEAPRRIGDKIARLVGAGPSELVATDSTSTNLFKVLSAALNMVRQDAPQRKTVISERRPGSMGDPRRSSAPYNSDSVAKTLGVRAHRRAGSSSFP